ERVELGGRLVGRLPPVQLVDLRREAGYPLSAPLVESLARLDEGGGKAILLLNRRGIAPALHCRTCGATRRCAACDVSLVLHADGRLRCHHCGFATSVPELCPECGSPELARIGAGTQRLERELEAQVPGLERIPLDADPVRPPGLVCGAARRRGLPRERAGAAPGARLSALPAHRADRRDRGRGGGAPPGARRAAGGAGGGGARRSGPAAAVARPVPRPAD